MDNLVNKIDFNFEDLATPAEVLASRIRIGHTRTPLFGGIGDLKGGRHFAWSLEKYGDKYLVYGGILSFETDRMHCATLDLAIKQGLPEIIKQIQDNA